MNSDNENLQTTTDKSQEINLEKRIKLLLEDKLWDEAKERCERLTRLNPDNPNAALYTLLAENKAANPDELSKTSQTFIDSELWKKAKQNSNQELLSKLEAIEAAVIETNKKQIAEESVNLLKKAVSDSEEKREAKYTATITSNRIYNAKKHTHLLSLIVSVILLILSIGYFIYFVYNPWAQYSNACKLIDQNNHQAALEALAQNQYNPNAVVKKNDLEIQYYDPALSGKYDVANKYSEEGEYLNAAATYRQLGYYKDSISKENRCITMLNGEINEIEEPHFFSIDEISKQIEEEKQQKIKAIEETKRYVYEEKLKELEKEKAELNKKLEEQRKIEQKKQEKKQLLEKAAMEKVENELAIARSKEEEAKRIAKETEKRRALMKVNQGETKTIKVNGVDFVLIGCSEGSFWMGSHPQERGRGADETQHYVTIPQGFYIGRSEITQAQYKAVAGFNPSSSFIKGDNKPVFQISWFMANEFCEKLNALTKHSRPAHWHFDLPTEIQWEYACRAGTNTAFNNGSWTSINDCAWYSGNTPARTLSDVAKKQPNAWGLFDMHGSLWEWCKDDYGTYADTTNASLNPYKMSGFKKILRGGSYKSTLEDCRSAKRNSSVPGNNGNGTYDIGFRIVLVAD